MMGMIPFDKIRVEKELALPDKGSPEKQTRP
jgi:hypothetical protein